MNLIFFKIDFAIMCFLDRVLLLLWNQFTVKRIYIQRVAVALYLIGIGGDLIISSFKTENLFLQIANGIILVIGLVLFGFLHLRSELMAKLPPRQQNLVALHLRSSDSSIQMRLITIPFTVMFIISGLIGSDFWTPLYSAGMVGWWFMMVTDAIFVPEEPPKRWKFKLPKLSINLPKLSPLPSPTPARATL